jgi:hypothetical protein
MSSTTKKIVINKVVFCRFSCSENDKDPFNGKSQNYNLDVNEGFVKLSTSNLITCMIVGFTLKMKSQSIAYVFKGSEHLYWILDLGDEMHTVWDL